ncbi:tRNA dihydrouridine synthase DusB [Arhodomonas aquaeolei]|uniref:tRNA dihydrouridine synthase DusB n=2 Tax=Arhodomonas aquaeolei TaxID=2369 RepID=UPI002168C3BC|nr:tRNA dihydrouridine synthase DusB [Arhodomonas aquaeolei]MCS4503762.1 tRNA dihydrouridine synthase DusB [Arhodomonas aquaeolei]
MQIGPHMLANNLALAPMAGVTDLPFRRLCRQMGAGLTISEMVASDPALRGTRKSRLRRVHDGEPGPRAVQIAGADPAMLARAAADNVADGAEIIDINMGCPAKKVCNRMAGSALLADEALVQEILRAVTAAVDVPVTLKIRTGVSPERRNGVRVAEMAQAAGIAALAVHGRTRREAYRGEAEYETLRAICAAVDIPVLANGDITTAERARAVLDYTGASGVMIARAAQGRPWIFREIEHYLRTGEHLPPPPIDEVRAVMLGHLHALHAFYGPHQGVRVARKHIGWYLSGRPGGEAARRGLVRLDDPQEQIGEVERFFDGLARADAA